MLSEKMEKEFNKQVNAELYSGYLYLSMATYLEDEDLPGFAKWMIAQSQEELYHAMKMYNYVFSRGGRVILEEIEKPKVDWEDIVDVFENVLEHEQHVTSLINNLVDIAIEEKDHASNIFLQWYVEEQVEEEETANEALAKVKRAKNSANLLFMLDSEFGKRVFTEPASDEE